jgi:hypothetical protein
MFSVLNERFSHRNIGEVPRDLFEPGVDFAQSVRDDRLGLDEYVQRYVEALPPAIREALRAVVLNAVERERAVTFAWAPGYDTEVTVWDVSDTDDTAGGITVMLRTRYPSDPHPLSSDRSAGSS